MDRIDLIFNKVEPNLKLFHTADWHLGKLVHGVYMTDDQRVILQEFIEHIRREKPDVVIIAGDIYDRAIPPSDAITLFNETLNTIILELNTPVIAISGNHDSSTRIDFGSAFMKNEGLHMVGELKFPLEPIVLSDAFGEVHFHPIPYIEPSQLRTRVKDDSIKSHDDAMKYLIDNITADLDQNARHIAIAHAFITHSSTPINTSESERPLAIGGTEFIQADHFAPFHYTALGHLHQAQIVKDERIQYSGSPLKYSGSEIPHKKGFLMIEIDEKGALTTTKIPLTPRRDVIEVKATLSDLLRMPYSEDYAFVTLQDKTAIIQPMEQVRTVFPNALHLRRDTGLIRTPDEIKARLLETREQNDLELFKAFYELLETEHPDEATQALFEETLHRAKEPNA